MKIKELKKLAPDVLIEPVEHGNIPQCEAIDYILNAPCYCCEPAQCFFEDTFLCQAHAEKKAKSITPSLHDRILAATSKQELDALVVEGNTYQFMLNKTHNRIQRTIKLKIRELNK